MFVVGGVLCLEEGGAVGEALDVVVFAEVVDEGGYLLGVVGAVEGGVGAEVEGGGVVLCYDYDGFFFLCDVAFGEWREE